MKKITIIPFLLSSVIFANTTSAFTEEQCIKVLGMGMYNQVLEEICGFNGNVSALTREIYTKSKCRITVNQEQVNQVSKEVVEDTISRSEKMGIEDFCNGNMKGYYALVLSPEDLEEVIKKNVKFN